MAGALTIQWPSAARPARTTSAYIAGTSGVGIYAPKGTAISAGANGLVVVVTADTVQIASGTFVVTYRNLQNIKMKGGETVKAGDTIGESAGPESITVMVHQELDPTALLVQPPAPAPAPGTGPIYVRAKTDGIRLREKPVDGKPIGQLYMIDVVESLESREETLKKLGVDGQWLNVKGLDGQSAYAAAWLLEATSAPAPTPPLDLGGVNITGMNLDLFHPLGHPDPTRLKGVGWVRFLYNVSYNPDNNTYGNTEIQATYNRYKPVLEKYARAGMKVLLVFTHQTYGEGQGYMWNQMDSNRWRDLSVKFADMLKRIAGQYKGQNLVHAFQIWNEMDAHEGRYGTRWMLTKARKPRSHCPPPTTPTCWPRRSKRCAAPTQRSRLSRVGTPAAPSPGANMRAIPSTPCPLTCAPTASPATPTDAAHRSRTSATCTSG
jgi:hypothetical protein